jgi:hypothetical protein
MYRLDLDNNPLGESYKQILISLFNEAKEYEVIFPRKEVNCVHGRTVYFDDGKLVIYDIDNSGVIQLKVDEYIFFYCNINDYLNSPVIEITIPKTANATYTGIAYLHKNYLGKLKDNYGDPDWYKGYIEKQIDRIQKVIRQIISSLKFLKI